MNNSGSMVTLLLMCAFSAACGREGPAEIAPPAEQERTEIELDPSEIPEEVIEDVADEPPHYTSDVELRAAQEALLDRYFAVYKAKDVDAMLALFDENIIGVLYPTTLFGEGIEAAAPGIRGDFEARPNAYAEMPHRFRVAVDQWVTFGESINGDERAPLMILFDLNEAGDRIEATYTQIAWSGMIDGPSVEGPTENMKSAFQAIYDALSNMVFNSPADQFAPDAALYAYPPSDLTDFGPVITGADDVYAVLAFKWGEGAWRQETYVSQYMQFVFAGSPARAPDEGLDRVALFTFDADPASSTYEKIIRVDVMGPSGG